MIIIYIALAFAIIAASLLLLQKYTPVELVSHARLLWKTWSVRVGALAAAISGAIAYFPDAAIKAWSMLPDDAKQAISPDVIHYVPTALIILGVASQYVRQKKLNERANADANPADNPD